jgi:hypothetical protein
LIAVARFERSNEVKRLFDGRERNAYFTNADLAARATAIKSFAPDLVLVLHFDTATRVLDRAERQRLTRAQADAVEHGLAKGAPRATKVYVAGGFGTGAAATGEGRVQLARHVLAGPGDAFARNVARQVGTRLGLAVDSGDVSGAGKWHEPGVVGRNLALTRSLTDVPVAYLEALYYNHPDEFAALTDPRRTVSIGGKYYPKRLVELSEAIDAGVVEFVRAGGM